jgi:hypothetical protein
MSTFIIAFGHKARRGKDTAVQTIVEERGSQYDIRRYAFADALKREATESAHSAGGMQNLIAKLREDQNLPDWVQYDPHPDMSDPLCPLGKQRTLLQWWGSEFRRRQDRYYWVDRLAETLEREKPQIALISDMRFKNEMAWVGDKEGKTVRMDREGFDDAGTNSGHHSEHELDDSNYDYIVQVGENDLPTLKRCAVYCFDHIVASMSPTVNFEEMDAEVETALERLKATLPA